MNNRCPETGLSLSYAYKKGCRCTACKSKKAEYTARDTKAAARSKKWHAENKDRSRKHKRDHNRKVWLEKYTYYLEKYGPYCNICGVKTSHSAMARSDRLCIDHCHTTGKIRGLLCGACNVGLGHFKDNVQSLENAIEYLKENGDV